MVENFARIHTEERGAPAFAMEQRVYPIHGPYAGQGGAVKEIIPAEDSNTWMYRVEFCPGHSMPYYETELTSTAPIV